jgi:hypothetical protein
VRLVAELLARASLMSGRIRRRKRINTSRR